MKLALAGEDTSPASHSAFPRELRNIRGLSRLCRPSGALSIFAASDDYLRVQR